MSKSLRVTPRYSLKEFGLKGELILYPDPRVIQIGFDDISANGAGISILSPIDEEQNGELSALVKASRAGNRIPVQLIFNNTKIPVSVVNMIGDNSFGICVNDNQKLAVLAEKGKVFFQQVVEAAVRKGAVESGHVEYALLSREFLPQDIKTYVESRLFLTMLGPIVVNEIKARYPVVKDKVETREDAAKVEGLFFNYAQKLGKDILLLMGGALGNLRAQNPVMPLDGLMLLAARMVLDGTDLFSEAQKAQFGGVLEKDYLKNRMPSQFRDLPAKHPVGDLVKLRFDTFSRKVFFIQGLVPHVCDYYLNKFSPPNSELVRMLAGNDRLVKTTLLRWIQNEMNEMATKKDKTQATGIEDCFRQAMYDMMLRRKVTNITYEETADLFDGKIPETFKDIRNKYLAAVCQLIDKEVMARFKGYKAETEEERAKEQAEKDEETQVRTMTPADLMKKFCWPKIVEIGEMVPLHREVGRSWIPKEKQMQFADLGSVVILPLPAYEEFLATAKGNISSGERPEDFFDEVDLNKIYKRTVEFGSRLRKDVFGLYMDTMQPPATRETVMEKVINNTQWNRYYIINKSKSYVGKVMGMRAPEAFRIVEENMLSNAAPLGEYV